MPPVSISFRRHAHKTADGSTLTKRGKTATSLCSQNIKEPTKIYASNIERTKLTADILKICSRSEYTTRVREILRGHKYFAGERIKTTKKDNFLTFFKEVAIKIGVSDDVLIKLWLNGHFPKKIMPKPEVLSDAIIKERFRLPLRVNKKIDHTIVFENITHDVVIAALFQRLTGVKYHSQFMELPKELESLKVRIDQKGKAILTFRNYKKDITERLNKILNWSVMPLKQPPKPKNKREANRYRNKRNVSDLLKHKLVVD